MIGAAIGTDTGLRFWLHYVQAQGGLTEDLGDSALVVLPPRLQTLMDLPDELVVTGDPDVAREDGATFLTTGHPVLSRAADDVLAQGDVGRVAIPTPATLPPTIPVLLERARDQFPVHHGKIDATGALTKTVRPVLRVGALVNYTVSAEDHYQERVECYLDALSRLELSEPTSTKLATLPKAAADGHLDLGTVTAALGHAHRIIDARAKNRRTSLSGQSVKAFAAELERAEAYYRDMLATIERRHANAPPERKELLAARTQAVREERARRLAEVREKYQPAHEIKPYRLQIIELAAWRLSVDVRRGDRRYPLTLDWLVSLSRFADIRCPHCQAVEPLVASKTRLGCTSCLATPSMQAVPDIPAAGTPAAARKSTQPAEPKAKRRPAAPPANVPAQLSRPVVTILSPEKIAIMGDKLSGKLWDTVASGDRRSSRLCSPNSPAAAAARLYGSAWAAIAIGVLPGETPTAHATRTIHAEPAALQATRGFVETTSGRRFPFLLLWRAVDGTPIIEEALPFDSAIDPAQLPTWGLGPGMPGMHTPPKPQTPLGAIGDQLWRRALPIHGLPIVLRCLAAWWRLPDQTTLTTSHTTLALAASLDRLISYRAGRSGGRYADAASTYCTDERAVRAASADLQAQLQLSRTTLW